MGKEIFAILWIEQVLEDVEEQEEEEEKQVMAGWQPLSILCLSCQSYDAEAPGFTKAHLLQLLRFS